MFRNVVALLLLGVSMSTDHAAEPLRIMPLGDSITEGKKENPSYRPFLREMLDEAGYDVRFVGSQGAGLFRKGDPNDRHEGHWGWRTDEILGKLPAWAAEARADVVLIHLGSNDVLQGEYPTTTVTELRAILRVLREANSKVTILVAEIIPATGAEAVIQTYNAEVRKLEAAGTADSRVILVDQFTGFDPGAETYDGLHPNEAGARKMAECWFRALKDVLPSP